MARHRRKRPDTFTPGRMFTKPNPKQNFPEMERHLAEFWKKENIFQRSVQSRPAEKAFSFYDGPPFATGLPHYGHILASTMKDMVPRYWTMRGYRVERRWGWDCHGLPVEYEKEKELGISTKKGIEEYGIDTFNESCRSTVLRYAEEWKKMVSRLGRFVDMENDYKTMETWYMESIWWVFQELWTKDLIYEGEKVMPYCTRCATVLSNFEAQQGYIDKQDQAVTIKFKAKNMQTAAGKPVYFLAWTTTPWTLPSNLLLAVGPEVTYAQILDKESRETFIFAKEALPRFYKEEDAYELEVEYTGTELAGMRYEPLFPYFASKEEEGAFKVVAADFVTTTEGTGIVHQAPYGEDDYKLITGNGISIVQTLTETGNFVETVTDVAGQFVFDANKSLIQLLKERGQLVRLETINHNYPHCWRCDTPLIYNPISTWFVQVTKLKEDLLANNKKINWNPAAIGEGRFGKWLENVRDWGISRNRYWGTPLPVWKCTDCAHTKVLGSIDDLYEALPGRLTKISYMRHGEGEQNVADILSAKEDKYHLTEQGERMVRENAKKYLPKAPDVIYASPLLRTQETAAIVREVHGGAPSVVTEPRIKEMGFGKWDDHCEKEPDFAAQLAAFEQLAGSDAYWSEESCEGAEPFQAVEDRVRPFIDEILQSHAGKHVLLVTHGAVTFVLDKMLHNHSISRASFSPMTEVGQIQSVYIDNTSGKEVDLHKHFVDDMTFACEHCEDGTMKRIPEVFDCWFESGSMPYAQNHYPFERQDATRAGFPADFVAEGADQTRGWFYTLHVLATALTDGKSGLGVYQPAVKNIIVNGTVLAEDGKKMSKRLKNYPDPMELMDKYGADAMRFYLMSSPVVQAEDLRFSERSVDEVVKKVLLPLWNSYTFFTTYANVDGWTPDQSPADPKKLTNKLDRWMMSELQLLLKAYHERMEAYDLKGTTALLTDFVDTLTNWYIRRSRRRFWKSDNDQEKLGAYSTLYTALRLLSQMFAPVCPFIAEEIFKGLEPETDSVHLSEFPEVDERWLDAALHEEVALTQRIVALGHSIRSQEKIKVRQPLATLRVALPDGAPSLAEQVSVLQEELNVKTIEFVTDPLELGTPVASPNAKVLGPIYGAGVQEIIREAKAGNFERLPDGKLRIGKYEIEPEHCEIGYTSKEGTTAASDRGVVVALDTVITEELRAEGYARDLVRLLQDARKDMDLSVETHIHTSILHVHDPKLQNAFTTFADYIAKETLSDSFGLDEVLHGDAGLVREVDFEGSTITVAIYLS